MKPGYVGRLPLISKAKLSKNFLPLLFSIKLKNLVEL